MQEIIGNETLINLIKNGLKTSSELTTLKLHKHDLELELKNTDRVLQEQKELVDALKLAGEGHLELTFINRNNPVAPAAEPAPVPTNLNNFPTSKEWEEYALETIRGKTVMSLAEFRNFLTGCGNRNLRFAMIYCYGFGSETIQRLCGYACTSPFKHKKRGTGNQPFPTMLCALASTIHGWAITKADCPVVKSTLWSPCTPAEFDKAAKASLSYHLGW